MSDQEKRRSKTADSPAEATREALADYDEDDLEKALMDTFPASDPVAVSSPTKPGRPNHRKREEAREVARPSRRRT